MSDKINLTPKKICDKKFEVTANGYYPLEVDTFLDSVMEDYYTFKAMIEHANELINQLEGENAALKDEIEALKQENVVSQNNVKKLESELSPQVDILKRISALEKAVFGNQNQE